MSTAERLNANVRAPRWGRVILTSVPAGGTRTVDLMDPAVIPPGERSDFWRGRYVRITASEAVTFAVSSAVGDVLVVTPVAGAPALVAGAGVPIAAGGAPEVLLDGPGAAWRWLQFASAAGATITISEASEPSRGDR